MSRLRKTKRGDSNGIESSPGTVGRTERHEEDKPPICTDQGLGVMAGSDPLPGDMPGGAEVGKTELDSESPFSHE